MTTSKARWLRGFIWDGGSRQVHGPFALLLLTVSTFALVFMVLEPLIDDAAFIVVSVPVVTAAWMYGLRVGVVASLAGFALTVLLQWLSREDQQPMEWLSAGGWLGFLAAGFVSAIVGRLTDLRDRLAGAHDEARELAARLVGAQEQQQTHMAHEIPPQDIRAAAYVFEAAYAQFPPGTVHLVVVDPGVGTNRRAIAVQSADAFFVCP